jgi:endonuclease G
MKQAIFFICLLFFVAVNGQDTVRIKHTNYTTVFSKSKRYPVLVEWWATKAKVGCEKPLARKDKFAPDPLLQQESDLADDYKGSGFDRGHICPAADNLCQTQEVQDECFYFTNMAAQYHSLNAGDWKSLETLTRTLALEKDSIHVWAGNVGALKTIGKVTAPKTCWKVIYVAKDKQYFAYVFENTADKPQGLHSHEVTLAEVKALTHFDFK